MRFSVGLIEWLFEWAAGFAGIIGVFILLLFIGAGIFFVGIFVIIVSGVLVEVFTHDEDFKLIPWRVALVIGAAVGLFLIRWYPPFAVVLAIGLIGMFIELIGTTW